jgi:hypothetical protein
LHSDAFYFSDADGVRHLVENVQRDGTERTMVKNNRNKIAFQFNWEKIINEYEAFIVECHERLNHERIISYQG